MRLGLSTYTYTWSIGVPGSLPANPLNGIQLLERAAALGVHVVQIADNLPLERFSADEMDALAASAATHAVQIEVGTRGIAPAHLRCFLSLAQRFSSPILRVVIDTPAQHPSPDETYAILAPLQPEFERAGVHLAIENHDRFPVAALANLVRRLGAWAGICLDTVNSFGALEGPQLVVETLAPLTINLHVKDFTIFRASHSMGFSVEGRPAGQGRLDLPWLLAQMPVQPALNAIIELWTPPEADLEATLRKETRWAEESVSYLRGLIPD